MFLKITLMIALLSTNLFASNSAYEQSVNTVENLLETEVGTDNTCLDEYIAREKVVRKYLIWAPPLTVVGAPVAFYAAGVGAAAISAASGITGWSALGYAVGAASLIGGGVLAVGAGIEIAKALEFKNNRYMIRLIVGAQDYAYDNEEVKSFIFKYRRMYPEDYDLGNDEILDIISTLDTTGELCNGIVTDQEFSKKTKKKLAKRRHLLRYIHNNHGYIGTRG